MRIQPEQSHQESQQPDIPSLAQFLPLPSHIAPSCHSPSKSPSPEQDLPSPGRLPTPEPAQSDYDDLYQDHDAPFEQDVPPNEDQAPPEQLERPSSPQGEQNHHWHIVYNRWRPLHIDIDELTHAAVLPKLVQNMQFVSLLKNASLGDPIAQMLSAMLTRIRNLSEGLIELDNPGVQHSIQTYLALEHASQKAYECVIKSTKLNFAGAPGVMNCLSFNGVEHLIAAYTGVEPLEHDMCVNSCAAFTGPFVDLETCPICNESCWNEAKL